MSDQTERNKEIVREYQDAYNSGNLDLLDKLLAPEWKTNAFPRTVMEQTVENPTGNPVVAGGMSLFEIRRDRAPRGLQRRDPRPPRLRRRPPSRMGGLRPRRRRRVVVMGRHRHVTTILAVATLVATVAAPRAGAAPDASPASAGNGYLLMIHATFEPRSHPVVDGTSSGDVRFDQGVTGITYASGAVAATRDGDAVVFHAIPYLTSTVEPVVVEAPVLEIQALGSDRRLLVEPNRPPGGEGACRFETSWYGHEGPVEACSAYRVAVSEFGGLDVVSVRLHFRDSIGPRTEVHHLGAHFLLHMAIEDLPVDLADVDRSTDMATPFVIESAVDPQ